MCNCCILLNHKKDPEVDWKELIVLKRMRDLWKYQRNASFFHLSQFFSSSVLISMLRCCCTWWYLCTFLCNIKITQHFSFSVTTMCRLSNRDKQSKLQRFFCLTRAVSLYAPLFSDSYSVRDDGSETSCQMIFGDSGIDQKTGCNTGV